MDNTTATVGLVGALIVCLGMGWVLLDLHSTLEDTREERDAAVENETILERENQELRLENKDLRKERDTLENETEELRSIEDTLRDERASLKADVFQLQGEKNRLESNITSLEEEVRSAEEEHQEALTTHRALREHHTEDFLHGIAVGGASYAAFQVLFHLYDTQPTWETTDNIDDWFENYDALIEDVEATTFNTTQRVSTRDSVNILEASWDVGKSGKDCVRTESNKDCERFTDALEDVATLANTYEEGLNEQSETLDAVLIPWEYDTET